MNSLAATIASAPRPVMPGLPGVHGDILDNCHGKTTSRPAHASNLDGKSSVYGSDYLYVIRLGASAVSPQRWSQT